MTWGLLWSPADNHQRQRFGAEYCSRISCNPTPWQPALSYSSSPLCILSRRAFVHSSAFPAERTQHFPLFVFLLPCHSLPKPFDWIWHSQNNSPSAPIRRTTTALVETPETGLTFPWWQPANHTDVTLWKIPVSVSRWPAQHIREADENKQSSSLRSQWPTERETRRAKEKQALVGEIASQNAGARSQRG